MDEAERPGPPPPRRPRVDRKVLVVALIGLVSVTGALFTWRSTVLAEQATDADRVAVAETVQQQQVRAEVATRVDAEAQAFARYREDLVLAAQLDGQVAGLRAGGRETEARIVEDAAAERREAAEDLARLAGLEAYVEGTPGEGEVTFAEDRRRADLRRELSSSFEVDPDDTAARADRLRLDGQRLVGLTIPLALAVLLLTVANLARRPPGLRPVAAGAGVAVWLGTVVVAVVGG